MSECALLRGWQLVDSAAKAVTEVLGPQATAAPVTGGVGQWTVSDPVPTEQPVGVPDSLITFRSAGPATVEIVPGSQGAPRPPVEGSHAVVRVELPPGRDLLLDGRCWFRRGVDGIQVQRWRRP